MVELIWLCVCNRCGCCERTARCGPSARKELYVIKFWVEVVRFCPAVVQCYSIFARQCSQARTHATCSSTWQKNSIRSITMAFITFVGLFHAHFNPNHSNQYIERELFIYAFTDTRRSNTESFFIDCLRAPEVLSLRHPNHNPCSRGSISCPFQPQS